MKENRDYWAKLWQEKGSVGPEEEARLGADLAELAARLASGRTWRT